MRVSVDLTIEEFDRLRAVARRERRPVRGQAAVLISRALVTGDDGGTDGREDRTPVLANAANDDDRRAG